MRGVLVALAIAFALTAVPSRATAASHGVAIAAAPTVYALQQTPAPDKTIDININTQRGGRWYANPVWIGIGALAVVVVLLLIVLAARGGGGTTIVKD
jgi:hypothetical protein